MEIVIKKNDMINIRKVNGLGYLMVNHFGCRHTIDAGTCYNNFDMHFRMEKDIYSRFSKTYVSNVLVTLDNRKEHSLSYLNISKRKKIKIKRAEMFRSKFRLSEDRECDGVKYSASSLWGWNAIELNWDGFHVRLSKKEETHIEGAYGNLYVECDFADDGWCSLIVSKIIME